MDDQDNVQEENVQAGQEKRNTKRSSSKGLKEWFNKFNKSKAGNRSLVKVLSKILIKLGWILFWFIVIVGLIMFLLTMPGMVMEKIKGLFKAIGDSWSAWWGEDTSKQFNECQVYQVADYLDEMGYDLKGYGFVTDFLNSTDQYERGGAEEEAEGLKVTADGVIRDDNDTIVTAKSEFINTYLISENYIYTIKNFNLNDTTGWTAFWNHVSALFSPTSALKDRTGMLVFWHDTGSVGERSGAYAASERGYIKFDPDTRKLLIKKGWTNGAMEFSLDGWTGRYGMPVDFLLTIHLATQMPDLAYDMATHFKTEVNILLNSSEGTIYGAYKNGNEYITYDKIMKAFGEIESTNWIADIINKVDNSHISVEEIKNVHELGIFPPGGCDCTKSEEEGKENEITGVGSNCKNYIKFIASRMMKSSDDSYKTYTPYIESVQNHWFRDVYFVEKTENDDGEKVAGFVDYDYQYELITGERWTLYETDSNGDFVYYVMNSDGSTGEKYTGKVISGETILNGENGEPLTDDDGNIITERIASRGEDGTLVVKKAKTIDLSSKYEDLGWGESEFGSYIAYNSKADNSTPNYDPMYSDDEIADASDELEKAAMKKMYIEIAINTVTQTGDGLRTETNPDIKKMFMSNNYFKYDGSRQRAEIIYALRKASGVEYGAIEESKIKEKEEGYYLTFTKYPEGKYTSEAEDGYYKLEDYVGNVSFQQDALNTFAMLENSHTVDADYIYKDFKELVVELGYFEKEELTESAPRLLQWVVPDIGSGGYPDRSIDKREEEYGTLVHSKMDIDANIKSTITNLLSEMAEEETLDGINEFRTDQTKGLGARMGTGSNISISEVGAIGGETKSVNSVSIDEFLASTREMCEYINKEGYDYCVYVTCDGDGKQNCHHDVYGNDKCSSHNGSGCILPINFEESQESTAKHNLCCATLVSWALQKVGVMPDSAHQNGAESLATWILDNLEPEKIEVGEPLKPGDILCYSGHIDLVGEEIDGGFVKYNGGAYVQTGAEEFGEHSCIQKISGWPSGDRIKFALRLNWGGKKDGAAYEGYEGNEAVVSPVTGILMEYGTYNKEESEENRQNIDLKYGGLLEGYTFEEEIVTDSETGEQTKEIKYPSDQVGYAVIKVLDAETYKKLESTVENKWKSDSLVTINEKSKNYNTEEVSNVNKHISFNEKTDELIDEDRNWTRLEETVYGYKEFAEQYEQFGIGGYYIYIDGFKCEKVDEELSENGESSGGETSNEGDNVDGKKVIPQGDALTIDSFKITKEEVNDEDFEPEIENLYEPDEVSKLMSEKYTKKLEAESAIKADASIGITFKFTDTEIDEDGNTSKKENEYILIKEGTVLGRTITDYELLEGNDFRAGKYGTYDEYVEAQKVFLEDDEKAEKMKDENDEDLVTNNVPLIGNYLRVIMQDTEGNIVENVEDYMKLDEEGTSKSECEFEQLAYYLGVLEEGFYEDMDLGSSYGVEVLNDGAGNTTAFGLTKAVAETVASEWPSFATHLASGTVPKDEAQDVFILVLEAAKESIQNKLTTPLDEDDSSLFALIDLHHASPTQCEEVISIYNSKNNNLSADEMISVFSEHWGTNENYGTALRIRGTNRGLLASEGRFFLYQEGSVGDEVIFDTETPWTEFCEAGGTYEMTRESSGLYHIEKAAYSNYSVSY